MCKKLGLTGSRISYNNAKILSYNKIKGQNINIKKYQSQ